MGIILSFTAKRGDRQMCTFVDELRKKNPQSEEQVITCAQEFLHRFENFVHQKRIDIVSVMKEIGIYTCQAEMEMDAFIAVDAEFAEKFGTTKVACVNQNKSNGFKRFAFTHELAHYIFDYDEASVAKYYNTYNKDSDDWSERRANIFAANILVPAEIFREKYDEYKSETNSMPDTITKLSEFFLVSPSCIETRIEEVMGEEVGI